MQRRGSPAAQGCTERRSPGREQPASPGARARHCVLGQLLGRAMTATVEMPTCCLWGRSRALRASRGQNAAGSFEPELQEPCGAVRQRLSRLRGVVLHPPASEGTRASPANSGREKTFPGTFPELGANPTWHPNPPSTAKACYCCSLCK